MTALTGLTAPGARPSSARRTRSHLRALVVVLRRVTGLVATLLIASMLIFGALYVAPGTPLTFLTHGRTMTPDAVASLKHQYHLDEPIYQQYWHWVTGALHGDFGTSILYHDSVGSLIAARALNTVVLVVFATVIIVVLGLALGVLTGLRRGWLPSLLIGTATGAMAIPAFVASVVLIFVFGVDFGWFPTFGPGSGLWDRLYHLTLPAIALALASVAFVARLTQAAVREELAAEHVQTAISRGLPHRLVVRRHVLRNASIPILTVGGLTVAGVIAGSVVVEQVFQLNGLGSYLVSSVQQKDFPVVQAICLIYVAGFVVLNTLIDIAYSLLDPRIAAGRNRP